MEATTDAAPKTAKDGTGDLDGKKSDDTSLEEDKKPPAVKNPDQMLSVDTTNSVSQDQTAGQQPSSVASEAADKALLSTSLFRMTDGIPRHELKLIISEAEECEKALKEELEMLQKALEVEQQRNKKKTGEKEKSQGDASAIADVDGDDVIDEAAITNMIESGITPLDSAWTLSALLGRLRHDLTTPLPPHSQIVALREQNGLGQLHTQLSRKVPTYLKKKRASLLNQTSLSSGGMGGGSGSTTPAGSGRSTPVSGFGGGTAEISQFQRLLDINDHPVYTREQEKPDQLMSLWRKITNHKSSLVFRKPVNPKEAPGYAERIIFPMDLSVMRKFIAGRIIKSYKDFSQRIALICHNCVKYNGRESDYALVAREFESASSEFIWVAVQDEIAEGAAAAAVEASKTATVPASTSSTEATGTKQDTTAPLPVSSTAAAGSTVTTTTTKETAIDPTAGSAPVKSEDIDTSKKRKRDDGDTAEKEAKAQKTE